MDSKLLEYFIKLDNSAKKSLINELQNLLDESEYSLLSVYEKQLNEKQGKCPHCHTFKYFKNGKKNGVQNYKCKSCNKCFTAYTGTWLAHIHKKDKLIPYIKLMKQNLSLDKIKEELEITKNTAFNWRHKIYASLNKIENESFTGITESDETFFLFSRKGEKTLEGKPRKRGKAVSKRGINNEHVAVIVTADRKHTMNIDVACLGRISKKDIELSIGEMTTPETILCSDRHRSYQSFVKTKGIEHHAVNASKKERVKDGCYHIQNVNSIHGRMKFWINDLMNGVASKNLQNYMNWFHLVEKFGKNNFIDKLIEYTASNILAVKNYINRYDHFHKIVQKPLLN